MVVSTLSRRLQTAGASLAQHYPGRVTSLAQPPAGSPLRPVMGNFGPPLVGYSLNVLAEPLELARRRTGELGPISWFGLMGRKTVLVVGPELTEALLIDRQRAFSSARGYGFLIGPFFHGGLLLRDFDDHLYHRRIMQQAFTRPRLTGYLDLANPAIATGIRSWHPRAEFPLYTEIKKLLLNVAAEVFMGVALGTEATRLSHAFEDAVQGGQALARFALPGGTWARGLQGRRTLEKYFREQLPVKRAGTGTDLFSVLCQIASDDGHTFTDDDIVDHMIFLMMAAHDTTTLTAALIAYHLAKHPDWQTRLRAESQALGRAALTFDDLAALPSLDLVFRETLRLYAPVGQHMREAVRDTDLGGHFIPAGTLVAALPYASMRMDPWQHGDDFDPERFSPERREDRAHKYAWAPFGGGAHKCIGLYFGSMEAKLIVHQMLLNYQWRVAPGYQPHMGWGTGPTPLDKLPVVIERIPA